MNHLMKVSYLNMRPAKRIQLYKPQFMPKPEVIPEPVVIQFRNKRKPFTHSIGNTDMIYHSIINDARVNISTINRVQEGDVIFDFEGKFEIIEVQKTEVSKKDKRLNYYEVLVERVN